MLRITVPSGELFDDKTQQFIYTKEQTLTLEHSLISISKWESRWKKAFLGRQEKTVEETLDYIRCMTLTQNVNPMTYEILTDDNISEIMDYISDEMTATKFYTPNSNESNGETVTSELIYHWMITFSIPFECEKWHLNRLLTLIRVRSMKNQPTRTMNERAILSRNAELNAARKKKMGTTG